MITEPGIYNLSMEEYQKDPCEVPSLSRGIIKLLVSECPAKAYFAHPRFNPDIIEENKRSWDLGTVVHSLLLEGIDIAEPLNFDNWRTSASKDAAAKSREKGKIPLLVKDYDGALLVVESAKEQLAKSELGITSLQAEGYSEQSCFWKEGDTWIRIRPDWRSSDNSIIIDLKTTSLSADPGSYVRQILSAGGDIQAYLYQRGIKKLTKKSPAFVFVVVEMEPPYLCSFISLNPQFMELGKSKVKEGIAKWEYCIASGEWVGYPNRIAYLDAPPWALSQWEERRLIGQIAEQNGIMPF